MPCSIASSGMICRSVMTLTPKIASVNAVALFESLFAMNVMNAGTWRPRSSVGRSCPDFFPG